MEFSRSLELRPGKVKSQEIARNHKLAASPRFGASTCHMAREALEDSRIGKTAESVFSGENSAWHVVHVAAMGWQVRASDGPKMGALSLFPVVHCFSSLSSICLSAIAGHQCSCNKIPVVSAFVGSDTLHNVQCLDKA